MGECSALVDPGSASMPGPAIRGIRDQGTPQRISSDVHLQAAVDEQANNARAAAAAGRMVDRQFEDGGATANSSFSVHQYGATLVAALSQQISCNAGQQATAAGTAYLQQVTNVPGGGQIAHLRVNTYRTVPVDQPERRSEVQRHRRPPTEDYVSSSGGFTKSPRKRRVDTGDGLGI